MAQAKQWALIFAYLCFFFLSSTTHSLQKVPKPSSGSLIPPFYSLFTIDLSFCSSSFFLISRIFVHQSFRKDGRRNSWIKASQLLGWIWMNLTIQSIILLKNLRHNFCQYHSPDSDFPADFSGPYITGTL